MVVLWGGGGSTVIRKFCNALKPARNQNPTSVLYSKQRQTAVYSYCPVNHSQSSEALDVVTTFFRTCTIVVIVVIRPFNQHQNSVRVHWFYRA